MTFKGSYLAISGINLTFAGYIYLTFSGIFCLVRGKFDHFSEKSDLFRDFCLVRGKFDHFRGKI
jgi:hypothetical protein